MLGRSVTFALGLLSLALLAVAVAYAWGWTGHRFINLKAVIHLPGTMSSFKADSVFYQSHSVDADIRRDYSDTSFYAEWPRHYIDIDAYPNFHNLTHNLDSLIMLYGWERVKQDGTNPWATKWVLDSLTVQLARGDAIKAKYAASDLGHYVADAHQPLHCTANYNGQFTNNYGIHSRYETTMINTYQSSLTIHPDSIHYVSSPIDFAFEYIYHSNSFVDSVLAADSYAKSTSGWSGSGTAPSTYYDALWQKCRNFTDDQFQRATVDLASLWYTAWVNAGLSTSVHDLIAELPTKFQLKQNYPNPFNPTTTVELDLPDATSLTMRVFNTLGQPVAKLAENKVFPPGRNRIAFNAVGLATGIYFCQVETRNSAYTIKMVLSK